MSFRKGKSVIHTHSVSPLQKQGKAPSHGTRLSLVDGRLTTSTGTASLDQLLGGNCGQPLGTSLLIEETGTTDFGGAVLRYFAAEGLIQGHHVHYLGSGDAFRRELPGLTDRLSRSTTGANRRSETTLYDKMKIAWRYEALGKSTTLKDNKAESRSNDDAELFCHRLDLTKCLESSAIRGHLHSIDDSGFQDPLGPPPFRWFLDDIAAKLLSSPPLSVHRILVPSLLSPTVYGTASCHPQEVLKFLHGLRGILRQFPTKAVALVTLPVSLYPRTAGLTRWIELLSDGVIELVPLPHYATCRTSDCGGNSQGLLRVHTLPVFHERGGGLAGSCLREDRSFKLTASDGIVVMPLSLPPVENERVTSITETELRSSLQTLYF